MPASAFIRQGSKRYVNSESKVKLACASVAINKVKDETFWKRMFVSWKWVYASELEGSHPTTVQLVQIKGLVYKHFPLRPMEHSPLPSFSGPSVSLSLKDPMAPNLI